MYSKTLRSIFEKKGISIGDYIKISWKSKEYQGILMPRPLGDTNSIVLKLDNGYNVGIRYRSGMRIELISKLKKPKKRKLKMRKDPDKPNVVILGAGGTIASRVDYRTGAVKPSFTAEELIEFNPELGEIANIDGRELFQLLSENMTPEHWQKIAREVEKEIRKGVDGIVIMHGTDTMGYTAAALSFMLEDLPVPVVLVGSQRSSDRGSSDSHMNLACAVKAATSDIAEVMVCMHGESSDTYCYLHRGTKARKMHTSARYAFRTVNTEPIAKVHWEGLRIEILSDYRRKDKSRKLKLLDRMEKRVSLVKIYPGMNMELLKEVCKRSKGIIIEGTGLGHVPVNAIKILKRFISEGGYVFMTSQCLYGRVNMNVYETGRDLLQIGVMGNYTDMLPETALVKMMWVLGNHKKNVKEMMERNLRGEITDRSVF